uniref:Uncharacterized protein n=1 Tax=Meloidogyne enterolobii TaxID=390850 RepID=A0A6V7Y2S4_MELEN|nr:unnamed protein product [Meloidogyne enterolobii]
MDWLVFVEFLFNFSIIFPDSFDSSPLLVPLTCWIPPPKIQQVLSFTMPQWKASRTTILQPTYNHQHLLVAGNELAPGCIYMFHIASQLLIRTFTTPKHSQVTSLCASRCKEKNTNISIQQQQHFFTSATSEGTIQIWSFTQADPLKSLEVSSTRIFTTALSSDDKWIVAGSADSCARIVTLDSGKVTKVFRDHTGPVVGLQISSDDSLLVTGSGDFAVMVWDIEKEIIITRLQGLMAPVTCLTLTRNDAFLAVACEDETLRVFSLVSAQELHELVGHESRINALQSSADDCKLFAGTKGKILVYDIHNGQLLEILLFPQERQPISSIKISDDDSFVLAVAGDRVSIWATNSIDRDVASAHQKEQQKLLKELNLNYRSRSETNESAESQTSLINNNLMGNKEEGINDEQLPNSSVSCIQIAPDEKGAGCGTVDGVVAFWDLDVCQCMWTSSQQRTGKVTALGFTTDSFLLLSGTEQGNIHFWATGTGQLLKQLQLHTDSILSLNVFVDGGRNAEMGQVIPTHQQQQYQPLRVVSCDSSDNAHIWTLPSLDENSRKIEFIASIANISPPLYVRLSDTVIIAKHASNPKEMNIWTSSGDRLFTRSKVHHSEPILCYALNRSGTMLITGSMDCSLKIWQMDTGGLLIQILVGHEEVPTCCCVSENGQLAVSGAKDFKLIVWDIQTGSSLHILQRSAIPQFMEISLDGNVFCSNGWIEAWNTPTGRLLSSFNTHREIEQLIVGADGDRILAKLAKTAQLPIICLHNTPASLSSTSASRYERVILSGGIEGEEENGHRKSLVPSFQSSTTPQPLNLEEEGNNEERKSSITPINSSNRDKEEQQIKPSTSDQQQQLINKKENKNSSSKETIYAAPPSEINIKEKENNSQKRNINSSTPRRHQQQHSLIKKQISSSNPESTIQGGPISTLDQKRNLNNIKKSKFCLIM